MELKHAASTEARLPGPMQWAVVAALAATLLVNYLANALPLGVIAPGTCPTNT